MGKISPSGNELEFSTYLGGELADGAWFIVGDELRNTYIAGYTASDDFPLVNPVQDALLGSRDATVSVLSFGCCSGMTGNVDYDSRDRTDVIDLLFYVHWLYRGGPEPACAEEADVNGDLHLDPQDLAFLIDFIWKFGPAPSACY